jgi:hypothetical protein
MLMIHIRAVPSLPFMALIRALFTLPASCLGRVAVHDWWLLSVMTHASSHWHPVLKVGLLLPSNGSNMFLQSNGKMVHTHHTIQCHEAEDHIVKLNRCQCQVNLKS